MVALPRGVLALACLGACTHGARISRKRSNDSAHNTTAVSRRGGYKGNLTAILDGYHAATSVGLSLEEVSSAEHRWTLPEAAQPHQAQLSGGGGILSDMLAALRAATRKAIVGGDGDTDGAPLGCFSEPDHYMNLGCMADCQCSWFQRCYPKFVEPGKLPAAWDDPPAQLGSHQVASGGGAGKVMVNVGHCSMGVMLMIFFTMLGFMVFVCLIVLFRAGSLAMQAVKEQAEESSKHGSVSSVLHEIRTASKAIRTPVQGRRSAQEASGERRAAATGAAQMAAARAG